MGRPLGFDPDDKLKHAMRLFWRDGYEATSLQVLVSQLGVNRFSLYNTFGDKRALFLAALGRYTDTVMGALLEPLRRPEAGWFAILEYLDRLSRGLDTPAGDQGCLLQNTALESVDDPQIQQYVRERFNELQAWLEKAFRRAQADGVLQVEREPAACARFVLAHTQGVIALRKATGDPAAAAQSLQFLKQQLESWRRT
jgi:TetR/AcrR family transcriptional regulator, transcriptional repressor for nem operon